MTSHTPVSTTEDEFDLDHVFPLTSLVTTQLKGGKDTNHNPMEVVTISQRKYQQSRFLASIDRLLSRKKMLLNRMNDMQDKLKRNQRVQSANTFKQQYSWLLVNLDVTNKALFAAMQEMRQTEVGVT